MNTLNLLDSSVEEEIKLPTLDEFLKREGYPYNSFVTEPGFAELYVRRSRRPLQGEMRPVLDIARVDAEQPGSGAFGRLAERLWAEGHTIYVECVLNPRFGRKLLELGFTLSQTHPACYFKLGKEKAR